MQFIVPCVQNSLIQVNGLKIDLRFLDLETCFLFLMFSILRLTFLLPCSLIIIVASGMQNLVIWYLIN